MDQFNLLEVIQTLANSAKILSSYNFSLWQTKVINHSSGADMHTFLRIK
jgi:hypothetical protein